MNSQEIAIQVWREKFFAEANQCAAAFGEAALQRGRADALQKELEALKKELEALKAPKKKHAKPNPPNLAAVG